MIDRRDERVEAFEEGRHAKVTLRVKFVRRGDSRGAQSAPESGVGHDAFFERVGVAFDQFAESAGVRDAAQYAEGLVGVAEVRGRVFDAAPERRENGALRFEHVPHRGLHRQAAEVAAPGNARSTDVVFERGAKARAVAGDRQRIARIGSGLHAQEQRDIADRSSHRACDTERVPRIFDRKLRDAPDRRPQADHVAEIRRVTQRTAEIGAVGERDHPGRERDGRAAAAPAAGLRSVVRIARRAEDGVERLRAGGELRHVRLPDRDRTGGALPLDDDAVNLWHEVAKERRAEGRAHPARHEEILVGDRESVQRSERVAARLRRVGRARSRERSVGVQGHDCVEHGIDCRDAREVRGHDLGGRNRFRGDAPREFDGVEKTEVVACAHPGFLRGPAASSGP